MLALLLITHRESLWYIALLSCPVCLVTFAVKTTNNFTTYINQTMRINSWSCRYGLMEQDIVRAIEANVGFFPESECEDLLREFSEQPERRGEARHVRNGRKRAFMQKALLDMMSRDIV